MIRLSRRVTEARASARFSGNKKQDMRYESCLNVRLSLIFTTESNNDGHAIDIMLETELIKSVSNSWVCLRGGGVIVTTKPERLETD